MEFQGVSAASLNTKQDKKRKRPDDKKQNLSKKMGNRTQFSNNMNVNQDMNGNQISGDRANRGGEKAILPK